MNPKMHMPRARKQPRLIEIVGPAGAGKTTLSQVLSRHGEHIHLTSFPDVRRISDAPFFIWNGLQISPTLLGLPQSGSRRLGRREFAWLSILNGWPRKLKKDWAKNEVILLDQGPVYLLAETREFGPEYLKKPESDAFWQRLYSRWADTLDVIVWLDVSDDASLLKRIRNRDKEHPIKNESVESALEFLARFRKAYEQVISNLSTICPGLRIHRFDTGQETPQEIADQLSVEFSISS